jgi:beta-glucosidase/6-phospho-beta-glucosidase/beta-galactosidase
LEKTTNDVENPCPGLGQAQKCGGSFNENVYQRFTNYGSLHHGMLKSGVNKTFTFNKIKKNVVIAYILVSFFIWIKWHTLAI